MPIRWFALSFCRISPTSWAAIVFLVGPFLSVLSAPFFLKGFERFGVQWHVLLVSCLVAAALVVPQAGFFPFVQRLFAAWRLKLAAVVFVAWLLAMGFVHGFGPQAESLLSAAMLLLMLPVGVYVALDPQRQWRLGDVALVLLMIVVALENLFLTFYFFRGLGFNQVYLNVLGPPRLFLNVRDGNFVALVQYLLAVVFCLRLGQRFSGLRERNALWMASVGFLAFQPFFNAWLTQGRALLLCLSTAIVLLIGYGVRRRSSAYFFLGIISLASGVLAFLFYLFMRFQLALMGSAIGAVSLIERGSGGRFELWRVWLESGFSNSIWWGHGLGFLPANKTSEVLTPHNVLVQVVSDGGIIGLALIFMLFLVGKNWKLARMVFSFNVWILFIEIGIFLALSSSVFWPSGMWVISILTLGAFEAHSSADDAPFLNVGVEHKCFGSIEKALFLQASSFLWLLLVICGSVFLIAAKYRTFLVPLFVMALPVMDKAFMNNLL